MDCVLSDSRRRHDQQESTLSNGMDSSSHQRHLGARLELFSNQSREKECTMKIIRVGVDLAKNVFQVHGVDRHGKAIFKRRLRRHNWLAVLLDNAAPGCERPHNIFV